MINFYIIAITISTNKHELEIISKYNPPNKKGSYVKLLKYLKTTLLGTLKTKSGVKINPNGTKLFQIALYLRIIISPPLEPTLQYLVKLPDVLDIALISNLLTKS